MLSNLGFWEVVFILVLVGVPALVAAAVVLFAFRGSGRGDGVDPAAAQSEVSES